MGLFGQDLEKGVKKGVQKWPKNDLFLPHSLRKWVQNGSFWGPKWVIFGPFLGPKMAQKWAILILRDRDFGLKKGSQNEPKMGHFRAPEWVSRTPKMGHF